MKLPTLSLSQASVGQRRLIIGIVLFLSVSFISLLVLGTRQLIVSSNSGTLNLTLVPADAQILLDNKTKVDLDSNATAKLSLSPGEHTITASRTSFTTRSISVKITAHQTTSQTMTLGFADVAAATAYYQAHPDQATIADGVGQQEVVQNGAIIDKNYPLIKILPYHGPDYSIDFGVSKAHPNDRDAVAIYISADTQAATTNAVKWIRAHGYDPNGYEIIYQSNSTPDTSGIIPDGD
jgi:hypothetical protein